MCLPALDHPHLSPITYLPPVLLSVDSAYLYSAASPFSLPDCLCSSSCVHRFAALSRVWTQGLWLCSRVFGFFGCLPAPWPVIIWLTTCVWPPGSSKDTGLFNDYCEFLRGFHIQICCRFLISTICIFCFLIILTKQRKRRTICAITCGLCGGVLVGQRIKD